MWPKRGHQGLHERYASDEKLIRRFEKEALSYGQVTHPI